MLRLDSPFQSRAFRLWAVLAVGSGMILGVILWLNASGGPPGLFPSPSGQLETVSGNETGRDFEFFSLLFFLLLTATLFFLIGVFVQNRSGLFFSNTCYRTFFEKSSDLMCLGRTDGILVRVNPAFETILGFSPKEMMDHSILDFIHPEDREATGEELKNLQQTGITSHFECRMMNREGGFRWFLWKAFLQENNTLAYGVGRDITERKKSEQETEKLTGRLALQVDLESVRGLRNEARYRTIFETSPEGLILVDRNGRIRQGNSAAARMLGAELCELNGKSIFDLDPSSNSTFDAGPGNHTGNADFNRASLEKILSGTILTSEWNLTGFNGKPISILSLGNSFGGSHEEILFIWRDLSEIKELESEKRTQEELLIQQSRLADMGQMLGSIAHQWKQPLSILYTLADEMKDQIEFQEMTPESALEIAEQIQRQAEFMNQTIDDFRRFLSPAGGKVPFVACKSIEEILRLFKHQLKKNHVEVELPEHDHFQVSGIPSEFNQAILNLIKNSVDVFTERNRKQRKIRIDFLMEDDKDTGVIRIEDSGGGIPESLLPDRLFAPYVTTKGERGTGIGLQIVQKIIIDRMQGSIHAFNSDEGACFEIRLPARRVPRGDRLSTLQ